ncbi:DNA repair protein RadC [Staphylococcus sp. NRL 16/872]|uniref:RadC family protein n=1 Tax=Staphylococcus sp. NRL 16/872 TaxID=2930131 RepID=UPI001FB47CA8|nr:MULTISPECIES: DNA repair protein RadC [unclassified Staphylococcus]MCJ1656180.1 DNA repair protein RadC [Staphylococcus sp. NRL 21/187]WEN70492.1 DNA repair protein RadC [Staphylococcus sp. NRL 16/872]
MKIKDMATSELPRERLIQQGAKSLSNSELLAILINTGRQGYSSIDIANDIMNKYPNLKELKQLSVDDLVKIKGIGTYKATTLKAAFELGERMNTRSTLEKVKIKSPKDVADMMMAKMKDLTQEHFVALFLNSKNVVIKEEIIYKGTLNSSVIHPREVYNAAIRASSNAIIVVHNHPSGDVTPSKEDIATTIRLKECGHILGIDLLDHIIIGDQKFTSLVEEGYFE